MEHELDDEGQPIHLDVDEWIPTGTCAICTQAEPETAAPEDRAPVTATA